MIIVGHLERTYCEGLQFSQSFLSLFVDLGLQTILVGATPWRNFDAGRLDPIFRLIGAFNPSYSFRLLSHNAQRIQHTLG
jgi:hypothetical protein